MTKTAAKKTSEDKKQKTPPQEGVLTKEDFLKALKKSIQRKPKASHGKGKRKTSG